MMEWKDAKGTEHHSHSGGNTLRRSSSSSWLVVMMFDAYGYGVIKNEVQWPK